MQQSQPNPPAPHDPDLHQEAANPSTALPPAATESSRDPRPTNENPNFVQDYFRSSRLHFIGSFRARYESMLVKVGNRLSLNPSLLLQNSTKIGQTIVKRSSAQRVIVHIDMDAFFASVAVRDNPRLAGLPIAVCHGGGEISSCSYEARKFGVRAGMFVRDGRKLCPNLQLVPYDFPSYEAVSIQIYARFFQLPRVCVEAVSVDEAYLDLTLPVLGSNDSPSPAGDSQSGAIDALVRTLRENILEDTGCTASAGIGPSKLLARLATKAAKPNGQFRVTPEGVISYLDTLSVSDLPGIGWRTKRRFQEMRINTVPELRAVPLARLQHEFGERQGSVFHDLSRGIDSRPVEPLRPRRSIGAEASWGIRFVAGEDQKVEKFFKDMTDEVASRVNGAGAYGTKIMLKIYRRIPDSDMTGYKHLGHGPCTTITRSNKLPRRLVGDALKKELQDTCWRMYKTLRLGNEELRGVGIQVTELIFADLGFDASNAAGTGTRRIDSFFGTTNGQSNKRPSSVQNNKGSNSSSKGRSNENSVQLNEGLPKQSRALPKTNRIDAPNNDTSMGGTENGDVPSQTKGVQKSLARADRVTQRKGIRDISRVSTENVKNNITAAAGNSALHIFSNREGEDPNPEGDVIQQAIAEPTPERGNSYVIEEEEDEIRPATVQPLPVQSEEANDDEDEDEIRPASMQPGQGQQAARPAPKEGRPVVVDGQNEVHEREEHGEGIIEEDIPAGWDVAVFCALPKELQSELLQDSKRSAREKVTGGRQTTLNRRGSGTGATAARNRRPPASVVERRPKRRRGGGAAGSTTGGRGQVTMTQIAQITTLRRSGTEMLNATEFRNRPLREVVDLLHDLQGGAGGGNGDNASSRGKLRGTGLPELRKGATEANDGEQPLLQLDIPSPPSLSSDSEGGGYGGSSSNKEADVRIERAIANAAENIQRSGPEGTAAAAVFADEPVWKEAAALREWMSATAHDVRSAHVELVRARAAELAYAGRLARAAEELQVLRRFAMDAGGGWPAGFDRLLRDIQAGLLRQRGFTLLVEPLTDAYRVIGDCRDAGAGARAGVDGRDAGASSKTQTPRSGVRRMVVNVTPPSVTPNSRRRGADFADSETQRGGSRTLFERDSDAQAPGEFALGPSVSRLGAMDVGTVWLLSQEEKQRC